MANRDAPMGLRALRNSNGSHPPVRQYEAVTSVIYEGQIVLLNTDRLAIGVTATISTVTGTAGNKFLGVAAAYKALASTAGAKKVQVYVDPNQLYVMQSDDATLDSRTNYVGRNFAITNSGSGNTTTLQAKGEIDGSTGTSASNVTTSARPIQIVDLYKQVGNAVGTSGTVSSNADFIVRIVPRYHLFAGSLGV